MLKRNGRAIRQDWSIENWRIGSLDDFNEDKSRIHSLNSPQNFALVRSDYVVNQETTLQRSSVTVAAMNNDYMMQILGPFVKHD